MKVKVDAQLCVGTGSCEAICPEIFEISGDGVAAVKVEIVPAEAEVSCREACDACPVDAIELEQ